MGPLQRSDSPTQRVFSLEEVETVKEALHTLLALFDEYAPTWFAESHRKQAQTANEILSNGTFSAKLCETGKKIEYVTSDVALAEPIRTDYMKS